MIHKLSETQTHEKLTRSFKCAFNLYCENEKSDRVLQISYKQFAPLLCPLSRSHFVVSSSHFSHLGFTFRHFSFSSLSLRHSKVSLKPHSSPKPRSSLLHSFTLHSSALSSLTHSLLSLSRSRQDPFSPRDVSPNSNLHFFRSTSDAHRSTFTSSVMVLPTQIIAPLSHTSSRSCLAATNVQQSAQVLRHR